MPLRRVGQKASIWQCSPISQAFVLRLDRKMIVPRTSAENRCTTPTRLAKAAFNPAGLIRRVSPGSNPAPA